MLEVDRISVYYGDAQALRDVSIKIDEGEYVAVVGSNGAGKTTLMRTISGLLHPKTGKITFMGKRIDELPPHSIAALGIGHIPEGRRLFPAMTVKENLEMGCYLKRAKLKKDENLKMVYELFPVLKERSMQLAGTLSGGEQQMLAIARSLMADPNILLIDEFSQGLAPLLVQKIHNVIKELKKRGLTILLVEQNVRLALSSADRAYVLENGSIVAEGTNLLDSDFVRKSYLGM
ncbi:ABC transporter ATP-binding protein [Candidatus Hecatella orcuttiae]|jgi:branched-chain amino acid transport system ATP-binding protein|uniref:ABC transporter ATP-binding protein n=1 Tax=Candidatus Hecatella orcuttiae TaxID=1935119 RepID=UPI0028681CDC|nr:ABC transporter ATP-binding protein [Candidatus Hecatella orcuttiae]